VVLVNGVITYLVSRSIIRPLNILKRGTEEIKQGNLEFAVKSPSRDEIGEVCGAFEEMRLKLRDSIGQQLQVEENRKELISNISHDLKTPITSIKGYVEGILDGVADSPEKMDKYIRTIYAKAVDMDRLIDDLFLFSKLDLKSLPFNFERTDIIKFFRDCSDELRLDFESRGVDFSLETELQSVFVAVDREKLKRVIMNILDNSVKYMDKGDGKICIRLTDTGESVRIAISDNGRGIGAEELPRIFDRFYRADPSRNTSTGGSGLGLAIAKQIVEGHGGTIRAESEPGRGTSMFIMLRKLENIGTEAHMEVER
jgi:signal transduction histidine kinase